LGSTHASNSFENEIASQLAAVALILRPKPVKAKRHLRFHKNFTKAQELEARVGSKSWKQELEARVGGQALGAI
jgi:superfamily II helicase